MFIPMDPKHSVIKGSSLYLHFFSINIQKYLSGIPNSLDPNQARHFAEPVLCPKCLQRLSADNKWPLAEKVLILCVLTISRSYAVILR